MDVIIRKFQTGPTGVADNMAKVALMSVPSSEDKLSTCSKNKEVAESNMVIPHDSNMISSRFKGGQITLGEPNNAAYLLL
jgi:hypothetical protein